MARKPKPTRIYREETIYKDGRKTTRQTFDKKQYDAWRKLPLHDFQTSITFFEGEIIWGQPEERNHATEQPHAAIAELLAESE
jgi:hypothetical protein